jgi:hypothetical protein
MKQLNFASLKLESVLTYEALASHQTAEFWLPEGTNMSHLWSFSQSSNTTRNPSPRRSKQCLSIRGLISHKSSRSPLNSSHPYKLWPILKTAEVHLLEDKNSPHQYKLCPVLKYCSWSPHFEGKKTVLNIPRFSQKIIHFGRNKQSYKQAVL